jgi:D-alanine-D-alanine ligase
VLIAILHNAVSADDSLEDQDVLVQVAVVAEALRLIGHDCQIVPCTLNLAAMQDDLSRLRPQAVFNLVESLSGDDGLAYLVPAVLDSMRIPYTGNSTKATFLTIDKLLAKQQMSQAGLPTPAWISDNQSAACPSGCLSRSFQRGATWIIKGVWEQASRNLDEESIVHAADESDLKAILRSRAAALGRHCFAEEFIAGREFNIAVLDGPAGPQVLPPAEIDFSAFPQGKPRIVGYRAKWLADSFEFQNTPRRFEHPASDRALLDKLRELSEQCWAAFDLRGYARVDFRVDQSRQPWILEINTNPCLSPDAGFAAAIEQAGIPFADAVGRIVESAICSPYCKDQ